MAATEAPREPPVITAITSQALAALMAGLAATIERDLADDPKPQGLEATSTGLAVATLSAAAIALTQYHATNRRVFTMPLRTTSDASPPAPAA